MHNGAADSVAPSPRSWGNHYDWPKSDRSDFGRGEGGGEGKPRRMVPAPHPSPLPVKNGERGADPSESPPMKRQGQMGRHPQMGASPGSCARTGPHNDLACPTGAKAAFEPKGLFGELSNHMGPPDKSGSPKGTSSLGAPENDRLGGTIEKINTAAAAIPQSENMSGPSNPPVNNICGNCGQAFEPRKRRQVPAQLVPLRATMVSIAFARGVAEARAGRPPRFDTEDNWEFERGRQWAIAAPPTMPLKIGCRLNPDAIGVSNGSQIP
jgi:hypothetical protein